MSNKIPLPIATHINSQVNYWQQQRVQVEKEKPEIQGKKEVTPFITISREYGCGGYEIARLIADKINQKIKPQPEWVAYDRKILEGIMDNLGLTEKLANTLTTGLRTSMTELFRNAFSNLPPQVVVFKKLAETVRTLAINGNVIIVGRAGRIITRELPRGYHVRIVAPPDWRIERVACIHGVSIKEAKKIVLDKNRQREEFLKQFIKFDSRDCHNYHIVINHAEHSSVQIVDLILSGMKIRGFLK